MIRVRAAVSPVDSYKSVGQSACAATVVWRKGLEIVVGVADAGKVISKLHIVPVLPNLHCSLSSAPQGCRPTAACSLYCGFDRAAAPHHKAVWPNLLEARCSLTGYPLQARRHCALQECMSMSSPCQAVGACAHLLGICEVIKVTVEAERAATHRRCWPIAGGVGLHDAALPELQIEVWYKDAEAQQGPQQGQH